MSLASSLPAFRAHGLWRTLFVASTLVALIGSGSVASAVETSISRSNGGDASVPDYANGGPGWNNLSVTVTGVSAGRTVTRVDVSWGVSHPNHENLRVAISTSNSGGSENDVELFNRQNGTGALSGSTTIWSAFDGQPVAQNYYLSVWDWRSSYVGYIDYFTVTVYYDDPRPDLIVEGLTVTPSPPVAGQSNTITGRVRNVGTSTADLSSTLGIFIDNPGSPCAQLATQTLAPGAAMNFSTSVSACTALSAGSHEVKAIADWTNTVFWESDEYNNAAWQTYTWTPPPLPNLRVTDIWLEPANPRIGETVRIFIRTQNAGAAGTGIHSFDVGVYLDLQWCDSQPISFGLGAGDSNDESTTAFDCQPHSAGAHEIKAIADNADDIGWESNEGDNARWETFIWAEPARPNLRTVSVTVNPAQPRIGETVTIDAQLTNDGDRDADGQIQVGYYLDQQLCATSTLTFGLAAGATNHESTHAPACQPNTPGVHEFKVIVDNSNIVQNERDEDDNALWHDFNFAAPALPNLQVSNVWLEPAGATVGEAVQLHAWIVNAGEASAAKFPVTYYLDLEPCATTWVSFGLGAGASNEEWTADPDCQPTTPGPHEIKVIADDPNTITGESDEGDNAHWATFTWEERQGVDLVVSVLSVDPPQPRVGDTVKVTAFVQNQGNRNAGPSIDVGFYLDHVLCDTQPISFGLDAGHTNSEWTTAAACQPSTPGPHEYKAIADNGNAVPDELDEENNARWATWTWTDVPRPDLRVASLWIEPPTPRVGDVVTVHFITENVGGAAAGTFRAGVYLDNASLPCGFTTVSGGLDPGDTDEESTAVAACQLGTPGVHEIKVIADDMNVIQNELDEDNNARWQTWTWGEAKRANLQVFAGSIEPAAPVVGQPVKVETVIANVGDGSTLGPFSVGYYLDGELCGTSALLAGLGAGASDPESTTDPRCRATTPGVHTITIVADYSNVVTWESDEHDNTLSFDATWSGPGAANLTVSSAWVEGGAPFVDGPFTVGATLVNTGDAPITHYDAAVFLDGATTPCAVQAVSLQTPGSSRTVYLDGCAPATSGVHTLTVVADNGGLVPETDEGDNTRSVEIIVGTSPDCPSELPSSQVPDNVSVAIDPFDGFSMAFSWTSHAPDFSVHAGRMTVEMDASVCAADGSGGCSAGPDFAQPPGGRDSRFDEGFVAEAGASLQAYRDVWNYAKPTCAEFGLSNWCFLNDAVANFIHERCPTTANDMWALLAGDLTLHLVAPADAGAHYSVGYRAPEQFALGHDYGFTYALEPRVAPLECPAGDSTCAPRAYPVSFGMSVIDFAVCDHSRYLTLGDECPYILGGDWPGLPGGIWLDRCQKQPKEGVDWCKDGQRYVGDHTYTHGKLCAPTRSVVVRAGGVDRFTHTFEPRCDVIGTEEYDYDGVTYHSWNDTWGIAFTTAYNRNAPATIGQPVGATQYVHPWGVDAADRPLLVQDFQRVDDGGHVALILNQDLDEAYPVRGRFFDYYALLKNDQAVDLGAPLGVAVDTGSEVRQDFELGSICIGGVGPRLCDAPIGGPCEEAVQCCGLGACSHCESACTADGQGLVCDPVAGAMPETCNGADDDCDGEVDEGLTRACSTTCGAGTETCEAGAWGGCDAPSEWSCTSYATCAPELSCAPCTEAPPTELCNGIDDDCDGETDETFHTGLMRVGAPCEGIGACSQGVVECAGEQAARCSADPGGSQDESSPERCNDIDDDCDGAVDEDFPLLGTACGVGACAGGVFVCDPAGAHATCSTMPGVAGSLAGPELCNGVDDDCDGEIDDGYPDDDGDGIADCFTAQQSTLEIELRRAADYILACQLDTAHDTCGSPAADGAINDVYPAPDAAGCRTFDWIVPRENALASLALALAFDETADARYRDAGERALSYLVAIQDASDGAWYDRYVFDAPALDAGKSPTQTAEVMLALYRYGATPSRIDAMLAGADYLIACADPANKGGADDGLVAGGLGADGLFQSERWASDNAFAYQALRAASRWAWDAGDLARAAGYASAAARILDGIDQSLRDPASGVWRRVVDGDGVPLAGAADWIDYAPAMLDLPAVGVRAQAVGSWIADTLQGADGAVRWNDGAQFGRRSPGFSLQASLVWFDLVQQPYLDAAFGWLYGSSLYAARSLPDEHGIVGGWVDWEEDGAAAPAWQRFVDTEFYWVAGLLGGYDFTTDGIPNLRVSGGVVLVDGVAPCTPTTATFRLENVGPAPLLVVTTLSAGASLGVGADGIEVPAGGAVELDVTVDTAGVEGSGGALEVRGGEHRLLVPVVVRTAACAEGGPCPGRIPFDDDADEVCVQVDNCPGLSNPEQADLDGDGLGDMCDPTPSGGAASPQDVDRNGSWSALDCVRVAQTLLGVASEPYAADITGDGLVSGTDLLACYHVVMGLRPMLDRAYIGPLPLGASFALPSGLNTAQVSAAYLDGAPVAVDALAVPCTWESRYAERLTLTTRYTASGLTLPGPTLHVLVDTSTLAPSCELTPP